MLGYDPEVSQSHLRANAKTGSPVWASDIYRKVTLVSLWDEQRRGNSERRSPVISQVSSSPSLDLLTHSHSSSFSLNLWMSCWVETVVLFPVTSECDRWDVKPRETCRGHSKPAHRKQVALKRTLVVCFFLSGWSYKYLSVCVQRFSHSEKNSCGPKGVQTGDQNKKLQVKHKHSSVHQLPPPPQAHPYYVAPPLISNSFSLAHSLCC